MDFLHQIQLSFRNYPENTAFRIRGESYTYAWLEEKISGYSKFLETNTSAGAPIAIACADDAETYSLLLACLFSGHPYIPIHPAHPEDRNRRILEAAGIQHYFSAIEIKTDAENKILKDSKIQAENTAYILFTSGSTGIPKGVPITHEALQAFIQACQQSEIHLQPGDKCLQMFDLTFDLSVFSFLYPLTQAACVCTVPLDEIKHLGVYRILDEEEIHTALMVLSVIQMLRPYFEDVSLPALKNCLFCGEALAEDLMLDFRVCIPNAQIRNVYGPTEATIFCMEYILPEDPAIWKSARGILSIGKPMPGMRACADEDGQLLLNGQQLTPGYLNDPEKNKTAFIEENNIRLYKTGDLVFQDENNLWYYTGRIDQQVKIQGYRIELGEIEYQIQKIIAPSRAVAVVKSIDTNQPAIQIFLELPEQDISAIRTAASQVLPAYMLPQLWTCIPEFPLNINGKTDRKALIELNHV